MLDPEGTEITWRASSDTGGNSMPAVLGGNIDFLHKLETTETKEDQRFFWRLS